MTSAPSPQGNAPFVRARWFDGRSSQGRAVLLSLQPGPGGPALAVHPLHAPGAAPTVYPHSAVGWPEAWNPRRPQPRLVVDLQDGGSLEIDDAGGWHAALQAAGQRASLAQRMQTRWPVLLAVLVLAAIGLTAFYRWGTPWAATQLTHFVPLSWETQLAASALQQMDEGHLKPTKLAPERQAALRARFDQLTGALASAPPSLQRYGGYAPRYTLAFRSGMDANAFALPGGSIVVTDDLVHAAEKRGLSDDAITGVLAHEIGHVAYRHTTRMVVEQGVLNIGLGLALGDVSGLLSTGSALLTGLHYRRNHEREADCFAVALMGQAQLPAAPMADLLLAIAHDGERREHEKEAADGKAGKTAPPPTPRQAASAARTKDDSLLSMLSSHPDTVQRAEALRAGQLSGCTR
ncbi:MULTISPECIES: M48 family metallopeptidase [unclassified Acidovorax]|uniref:M48 family metallopeptidase n=1 Tax=unclassified Acidovorax TaxID=2684926 RepID=UPI0028831F36|nr:MULTISPECIES: M48 family metallopeptidase [unclassified Acidovorax]